MKGDDGGVHHTYSTFARRLDLINPAYNLLDLTPLGRQEEGLPFSMSWVRLRDSTLLSPTSAVCVRKNFFERFLRL